MKYYSAQKRNELSSHEKTWSDLKCMLLSERSQSENFIYCMIPTPWHSEKGKTMETVEDQGWSGVRWVMNRWSTEGF